jgi:hypothetical protein
MTASTSRLESVPADPRGGILENNGWQPTTLSDWLQELRQSHSPPNCSEEALRLARNPLPVPVLVYVAGGSGPRRVKEAWLKCLHSRVGT